MQLAFDLISDLHVDTWDTQFDWSGQPTSPHCVVIGDVCENRNLLYSTLEHLVIILMRVTIAYKILCRGLRLWLIS